MRLHNLCEAYTHQAILGVVAQGVTAASHVPGDLVVVRIMVILLRNHLISLSESIQCNLLGLNLRFDLKHKFLFLWPFNRKRIRPPDWPGIV
jgi:hypothetical protein